METIIITNKKKEKKEIIQIINIKIYLKEIEVLIIIRRKEIRIMKEKVITINFYLIIQIEKEII